MNSNKICILHELATISLLTTLLVAAASSSPAASPQELITLDVNLRANSTTYTPSRIQRIEAIGNPKDTLVWQPISIANTPTYSPTWAYPISSAIHSISLCDPLSQVIIGTHSAGLHTFDISGNLLWSALSGHEEVHAAASKDCSLIVATSRDEGKLYAFNQDGHLLWTFNTQHPIAWSWETERWLVDVSENGSTVTAVLDDGYVVTLDGAGQRLWEMDFRQSHPFTNTVCAPNGDGGEFSECIQSMKVSGNGDTIVIGIWYTGTLSTLYSFQRNGNLRWQRSGIRAESVDVSWDGSLIVADADIIYAYDGLGNLLWSAPSDRWAVSLSDFWQKHVAVSSDGERIYGAVRDWIGAFNRQGILLWSTTGNGAWLETDAAGQFLVDGAIGQSSVNVFKSDGTMLMHWQLPETDWSWRNTISRNAEGFAVGMLMNHGVYGWHLGPPVVSFTATPPSGPRPLTVYFSNRSSGLIDSYLWNFGDGSTSTETTPVHCYWVTGTFTVSLAALGPLGSDTITRTDYIRVWEPVSKIYLPLMFKANTDT